jgi:uncharacterized protein YlaI
MTENQKRCIKCAKIKDLSEFSKESRSMDGRRPDCIQCRTESRRVLSAVDYDALYVAQGGKCAICDVDSTIYKRRFNIDHNHEDNSIRALLCHHCNILIGVADESFDILQRAFGYLQHHNTRMIK